MRKRRKQKEAPTKEKRTEILRRRMEEKAEVEDRQGRGGREEWY